MKENKPMYRQVVVKIGTNVLTDEDGYLNSDQLYHLVEQIAELKKEGTDVILISSGAFAAGKNVLQTHANHDPISRRQLWSSLGQVTLINTYDKYFKQHNLLCSQILVTKSDFRDRQHYLNMQNCISVLLKENVIPIINENDATSITELMFTDNDELAGLIASMMDFEALMILSNIDGLYTGNPADSQSKIIPRVDSKTESMRNYISPQRSNFGRGGMITKANFAKKTANSGVTVYIANGLRKNIITDILHDDTKIPNTKFVAGKRKSNVKKWIAHSAGFEKGTVYINQGAKQALQSSHATSLLLVGIIKIQGDFKKGDIIQIKEENGSFVGLGRSQYDASVAMQNIGRENCKPLIHYDYLYLEESLEQ